MIKDRCFLTKKGELIVPGDTWESWEDAYVKVILETKAFRLRRGGSYTIVDPGGEHGILTQSGQLKLISLAIPNGEFWGVFQPYFDNARDVMIVFTTELNDSKRVKKLLKDKIKEIKQDLMSKISARVSEETGLSVQFAWPPHSPAALYYMYGSELFHVKNVLDPDATTVDCGKFSE